MNYRKHAFGTLQKRVPHRPETAVPSLKGWPLVGIWEHEF